MNTLADETGRESLDDFLVEWRAEVGPATAEETAWAERALGLGS